MEEKGIDHGKCFVILYRIKVTAAETAAAQQHIPHPECSQRAETGITGRICHFCNAGPGYCRMTRPLPRKQAPAGHQQQKGSPIVGKAGSRRRKGRHRVSQRRFSRCSPERIDQMKDFLLRKERRHAPCKGRTHPGADSLVPVTAKKADHIRCKESF